MSAPIGNASTQPPLTLEQLNASIKETVQLHQTLIKLQTTVDSKIERIDKTLDALDKRDNTVKEHMAKKHQEGEAAYGLTTKAWTSASGSFPVAAAFLSIVAGADTPKS